MVKPRAWHPFLFAAYPALALFAANLGKFSPRVLLAPLALSLALALLLLVVLGLLLRDGDRAAALTSLFLVLFFSYGQVYNLVHDWRLSVGQTTLGPSALLLPVWCLLLGLGTWFVLRTRCRYRTPTHVLNAVAVALVAFPAARIGVYAVHSGTGETQWAQEDGTSPMREDADRSSYPHIYYVILDGYARADVLKELYGYDNSPMLDYLVGKRFYVAGESKANYAQTGLSLASSLNMGYLDDLAGELGAQSGNRVPLQNLMRNNRAAAFLRQRGYEFVALSSGYTPTEITNADVYVAPASSLDEFENGLLDTTPIPAVIGILLRGYQYDLHRQRILATFEHLPRLAESERPAFVFAHILVPHPPFVFGAQGEEVDPEGGFSLGDGRNWMYGERYPQQLAFVNQQVQTMVDAILARSARPVVIILQGDHGPGSLLDWKAPPETFVRERMPILNAYYLPDTPYGQPQPYAELSPVNTFRLVFDRYFGAGLDLLEDRSYVSTWERPYQFQDVTDLAERRRR